MDRRSFVRYLAGVAGNAFSSSSLLFSPEPLELKHRTAADPLIIENTSQRLALSPVGESLTFQSFLRSGEGWKPATLAGNVLISGPSFHFQSTELRNQGNHVTVSGIAHGQASDGTEVSYDWASEISALPEADGAGWFRFRTTLTLPQPLALRQSSRVEPQIIVWLSSASTLMEGQSGSWRRILLQQPTRNSLGAYGNDLPALYLFDQNLGVETMMYFDFSDMGWMSLQNLPRFLVYRCSSVSMVEPDGNQKLGVGLVADQLTGNVLPAGEIRFTYYLLQRSLDRLLTEQEAATRWISALLPVFTEKLNWPGCSTSWKDTAAGTVGDLQNKDISQIEVHGQTGLLSYIKDTSKLWQQTPNNFELMAVSDVLWPSLLYNRLASQPSYEALCNQWLASLPAFYDPNTHTISNRFIHPEPDERIDSWYFFECGLIKYPSIGMLAGSPQLTDNFLAAFETARKTAQAFDYLFPVYYHIASNRREGAGTNFAVGGLYAWSAILAHRLTGKQEYLEEGRRAIAALYVEPSDRLFHEPQELSYGALAAAELGMRNEAEYLLSQLLRLFYWYSDPSQNDHDIRGMVQACASILYPAFKENVETILPWTGIMKRGIVWDGLLRFLDQQRRNNFYFFSRCYGSHAGAAAEFIPYENLGTLELGGQTGNVGKEIYGAGESLWMYLMFEALGRVDDRELMLVNLDLLDVRSAEQFPPRELHFILFNPTPDSRTARFEIPAAADNRVTITSAGKDVGMALQIAGHEAMRLNATYIS